MNRILVWIVALLVLSACEPVDVEGGSTAATTTSAAALPPVVEQVLVAKSDIEAGAEVTDELVVTREIEKKYVTADMLLAAERGNVIGRAVEHAIPAGGLLHDRDFIGTEPARDAAPKLEPVILAEEAAPKREVPGKAMAALLAKGKEAYVGTLTIQPGAGVPQHKDPTEEYLYVLTGGGTITIEGTSTDLRPGMSVFMPADAEVSFQNGDEVTKVVQVFGGPGPSSKYDAWQEVAPDAE